MQACHKPTIFLNEYANHLGDGHHIDASLTMIHHTLAQAGLNIKQVQKLATECSPTIQAHHTTQYPTEYLMCLDEVSKDDCTYAHLWGWSPLLVELV
jgi:hypothetical protein